MENSMSQLWISAVLPVLHMTYLKFLKRTKNGGFVELENDWLLCERDQLLLHSSIHNTQPVKMANLNHWHQTVHLFRFVHIAFLIVCLVKEF